MKKSNTRCGYCSLFHVLSWNLLQSKLIHVTAQTVQLIGQPVGKELGVDFLSYVRAGMSEQSAHYRH